jgi:hypothetical protein
MRQVDGRIFRVSNQATDSFSLEGENTTGYDTFVSGTAQKITFGTSIVTATSMSSGGGNYNMIDVTTIHGNQKRQVPGLQDAVSFTFDNLWDPADTGQVAMKAASDAGSQLAFMWQFGTGGPRVLFTGYVGFTGAPGGSAQDKVTTQAVITAFGSPTYYSS